MRKTSKAAETNGQEVPPAVAAALHEVEECLVSNLVEVHRAAADGTISISA